MPTIKNKKKQYRIRVTQKDIRLGKAGEATECPIALACKRIPALAAAEVDSDNITLYRAPFRMALPPLSGSVSNGEITSLLPDDINALLEDVNDAEIIDGEIHGTRDFVALLTKKAKRFVRRFDISEKVKPFEFTITI